MNKKLIKKIPPYESFYDLAKLFITTMDPDFRQGAIKDDLGTHIVDTMKATDTQTWETGIQPKDKDWIIVQQYETEMKAKIGHKNWVNKLRKNPNLKLKIFTREVKDNG